MKKVRRSQNGGVADHLAPPASPLPRRTFFSNNVPSPLVLPRRHNFCSPEIKCGCLFTKKGEKSNPEAADFHGVSQETSTSTYSVEPQGAEPDLRSPQRKKLGQRYPQAGERPCWVKLRAAVQNSPSPATADPKSACEKVPFGESWLLRTSTKSKVLTQAKAALEWSLGAWYHARSLAHEEVSLSG